MTVCYSYFGLSARTARGVLRGDSPRGVDQLLTAAVRQAHRQRPPAPARRGGLGPPRRRLQPRRQLSQPAHGPHSDAAGPDLRVGREPVQALQPDAQSLRPREGGMDGRRYGGEEGKEGRAWHVRGWRSELAVAANAKLAALEV